MVANNGKATAITLLSRVKEHKNRFAPFLKKGFNGERENIIRES